MIGVVAQPTEREAAREFFELCKTSWEFWRPDGRYEVVLATSETVSAGAPLVLIFSGTDPLRGDAAMLPIRCLAGGARLSYGGRLLPIYGRAATFPSCGPALLRAEATGEPALSSQHDGKTAVVRVGYNLFEETRILLGTGQPAENAGIPALELHIALLRDLITRAGLPFVEIPPVPDGHAFMACLTHDIDHPVLRNHRGDPTMFGFLYRATIGSVVDVCRGKRPARILWRNWRAAGLLPFIHLGMVRDPWLEFDRYRQIEGGKGSTFFVIPRKGHPGKKDRRVPPRARACCYDLDDVMPALKRIIAAGGEVGLHGLDAWLDVDDARSERGRVAEAVDSTELGVRMHWLYFDENTPAVLDQAGFAYDSTVGYNETIGYRAGTTQVYRHGGTTRLLELPLHVMDTALFYPDYLDLGEDAALRRVRNLVDEVATMGGVLTVNWHDRSIFAERWWDGPYRALLGELERRGAWFPTAAQAVAWFQKRRTAVVEWAEAGPGLIRVWGRVAEPDALPDLRIRVHKPRSSDFSEPMAAGIAAEIVDVRLTNNTELQITL